jgi:dienelactone hydrolase
MKNIFKILILWGVFMSASANAAMVTKEIQYKDGDVALKGMVAYDDAITSPKPGILLVPEWWGTNDYIKKRTREMAELGYVAFVADMYGEDKVTTDPKQATEWSAPFYSDRALMRNRARVGLAMLKQQKNVDTKNIAIIGFCFGGTVALELARDGEKVKGVGVFHAGLQFPEAVAKGKVKAKVLVMNGAADPMAPTADRDKFIEDMQNANADLQFIQYSGVMHAFTNPEADKFKIPGVKYNAKAEKRSFAALKMFFSELF